MALELALITDNDPGDIPAAADFEAWANSLAELRADALEVVVRVVSPDESRGLNQQYRQIDKPTNVLSFPAEIPAEVAGELEYRPLGDLVICADVVSSEAAEQGKTAKDHWAHMTIHGLLHLLGFDHEDEASAEVMELRERDALASFGISDPYEI